VNATVADLDEAAALLQECLKEDPDCTEALWQLAALRATGGDREGLAALSTAMERPDVDDPRFHFLAAACHLAAKRFPKVLDASERAAQDPTLSVECDYLRGWAHYQLGDSSAATASLRSVAKDAASPSADHARALLGGLYFTARSYDEATQVWEQMEAPNRTSWRLDGALRDTVFLTGLLSYQQGHCEQAAERFARAGRLGRQDASLNSLTALALVRAGQRLLNQPN
jgi:tetratricopeptide (TPR) repeat protein